MNKIKTKFFGLLVVEYGIKKSNCFIIQGKINSNHIFLISILYFINDFNHFFMLVFFPIYDEVVLLNSFLDSNAITS